ncbi:MAG: hypothetical protein AB1806_00945 [Acidobacteriota bacterium]
MSERFELPVYVAPRTWLTLGQEYRVYPDRVELGTWLGRLVIPFESLVEIDVRRPVVIADAFRSRSWAYFFALKVDLADFTDHVSIVRTGALLPNVRFNPVDPGLFVRICRDQMAAWEASGLRILAHEATRGSE